MITYRQAFDSDVVKIKELTDEMLKHTSLGLATEPKIRNLVNNKNTLVLLALDNDLLIGYICGILHESVFNNSLRVTDVGVYINPSYRGRDIADNMIEELENWAKEKGAKQVWLGQTTGGNIDIAKKIYERHGYVIVGVNSVKEI